MLYSKKQMRVLVGTILLMMAYALVHNSVGYFVAPVTESLGVPRSAYTMYYTILQMVGILVIPMFGRLFPKIENQKLLVVGAIWGGLGFAGFGLSHYLWMFYIAGIWLGIIVPGCTFLMAVVTIQEYFGNRLGAPMGITMAGTGVSGILQGFLLPLLIESTGWQNGYFIMGIFWTILLLGAAVLIGEKTEPIEEMKQDLSSDNETVPWTWTQIIFLLVILTFSLQGSFLHHMQAHYAQQGMPVVVVGVLMSIFNVFIITFKIAQGVLFDRLGVIPTTIMAYAAFAGGMLVALATSSVLLFFSIVLLAFGMSSETVLTPLITRSVFGSQNYAIIYGRVTMAYNIGIAISSPLWGAFYDRAGNYLTGLRSMPLVLLIDLLVMVWLLRRNCPLRQDINKKSV